MRPGRIDWLKTPISFFTKPRRAGLRKDVALAVRYYQNAATNGNTQAMGELGLLYMNGDGVPRDEHKGFELLKVALGKHEDPEWQSAIANAYYHGKGVKQDYALAALWYRRAADSGNRDAQRRLSHMLHKGLGVKKDDKEAARLFRLSERK